jgi:hypothetical protein
MTAAARNTDDSQVTFLKILFAAQKKFYDDMKNGWNPFRVMWRAAFESIDALNEKDLTALLAQRPQAFGRMIAAEEINGQGGKFKMRDAVVDALVTEVLANVDVSGLDRSSLTTYELSAPELLRDKVSRFLGGATVLTIVAGGNEPERHLGA